MKRNARGFTIVELLIVIVVIAILAAITVVSYQGIQRRAYNTIRASEVQGWRKIFESYKGQHGAFPNVPTGYYCLGTGFPNNLCRDIWAGGVTPTSYDSLSADNVTLLNELSEVSSSLPTKNPQPVYNTLAGPYIYYWGSGFNLFQPFEGGPSDCPSGMDYSWDSGDGMLICQTQVGS